LRLTDTDAFIFKFLKFHLSICPDHLGGSRLFKYYGKFLEAALFELPLFTDFVAGL
jgi:hypothetical protein